MECETQYIRSDRTQILIDIRTCDMTLTEVMSEIQRLQAERPDQEVFMDGDLYAIVSRPKRITTQRVLETLSRIGPDTIWGVSFRLETSTDAVQSVLDAAVADGKVRVVRTIRPRGFPDGLRVYEVVA